MALTRAQLKNLKATNKFKILLSLVYWKAFQEMHRDIPALPQLAQGESEYTTEQKAEYNAKGANYNNKISIKSELERRTEKGACDEYSTDNFLVAMATYEDLTYQGSNIDELIDTVLDYTEGQGEEAVNIAHYQCLQLLKGATFKFKELV